MQFSHFIIYPSLFSIETQLEEERGQGEDLGRSNKRKWLVRGRIQSCVIRLASWCGLVARGENLDSDHEKITTSQILSNFHTYAGTAAGQNPPMIRHSTQDWERQAIFGSVVRQICCTLSSKRALKMLLSHTLGIKPSEQTANQLLNLHILKREGWDAGNGGFSLRR